jgi:hypothetical protein
MGDIIGSVMKSKISSEQLSLFVGHHMKGIKLLRESLITYVNDVFHLFHVIEISPLSSIPWVILYYGCKLRVVLY